MRKPRVRPPLKKVRLVRKLVYEGSEEWIKTTMHNSYVPAEGRTNFQRGARITSSIESQEIIDEQED